MIDSFTRSDLNRKWFGRQLVCDSMMLRRIQLVQSSFVDRFKCSLFDSNKKMMLLCVCVFFLVTDRFSRKTTGPKLRKPPRHDIQRKLSTMLTKTFIWKSLVPKMMIPAVASSKKSQFTKCPDFLHDVKKFFHISFTHTTLYSETFSTTSDVLIYAWCRSSSALLMSRQ